MWGAARVSRSVARDALASGTRDEFAASAEEDRRDMQRGWGWALLPHNDKAFNDSRYGDFVDGVVGSLNAGVQLWRRHISISAFNEGVLASSEDSDPLSVAKREYLFVQGAVSVGGFEPLPRVSLGFALGRVVVVEYSAKGTNLSFSVSYQRQGSVGVSIGFAYG